MPHFTLKDLFWAVTLIGLGIAGPCVVAVSGPAVTSPATGPVFMALAFFSPALIGAGIGALLQRKEIGFLIGVTVGVVFLLLMTFVAIFSRGWY